MRRTNFVRIATCAAATAAIAALFSGCTANLIANQITVVDGNVQFQFVNDTQYRAIFSYGTWNSLERNPPGNATLEQFRLAANGLSTVVSVTCRRNAAVGTQEFITRAAEVNADDTTDFDPDAFVPVIRFSGAPEDSDAAGLPTAGTALGVELELGVDYSCGDLLLFTFSEDAAAQGGFRVDVTVVRDE